MLDRLIMLGEHHLRRAIAEFVAHYHAEQNHQGRDNDLIQLLRRPAASGAVRRRQRMGGILTITTAPHRRGPSGVLGQYAM
jgi:putative transposase